MGGDGSKEGGVVRCGVLFGPENNGLDNEDMSYADGIVRAVVLNFSVFCCWEWRRAMSMSMGMSVGVGDKGDGLLMRRRGDGVACRGSVVGFMRRLEFALEGCGFYRGDGSRDEVRLNLRAVGMRAGMSEQELRTLEGVLSALLRGRRGE